MTNFKEIQGFDGVRAIVTGGASGIGLATAVLLEELGAHVVGLDLDASGGGREGKSVYVDVADDDSVRKGVTEAATHLGGIDVVINSAGIGTQGNVTENSDEEWRKLFEVNVLGVVRVSRAALPHLLGSECASIVNVCSIVANLGFARRAAYAATKGAVLALTVSMAADHIKDGVRVNAVSPGTADTPWVERLLSQAADPVAERLALEARQPMGRLVSAHEVAFAIAYLASPMAKSTTGTVLPVDAGIGGIRTTGPGLKTIALYR